MRGFRGDLLWSIARHFQRFSEWQRSCCLSSIEALDKVTSFLTGGAGETKLLEQVLGRRRSRGDSLQPDYIMARRGVWIIMQGIGCVSGDSVLHERRRRAAWESIPG